MATCFSIYLEIVGNKEIGLKLFGSCLSPPLWRGTTLANLSKSGKIPVEIEVFINVVRGCTI